MADLLPPLPSADELYENAPAGLLVLGPRGTILRANRTFCRWLGLQPGDLVGHTRLQELLTVGGRMFHQTHWLPLLEMQGSLSEVRLDFKRSDGTAVPMMLNVVRRTHAGGVFDEVSMARAEERTKYERELLAARKRADGLLASEREAQERLKATQSRLRQAVQLGRLYLWEMDLASGERRYDGEVARLLGLEGAGPVRDEDFGSRIHPEDQPLERAALQAALAGADAYHATYRLLDAGGVQHTVVSAGSVLQDDAGRPTHIVGVLSDITEISRQREVAEDRALFAEQMVAIVSHDLRTPLSAILVGAEVLTRGEEAPPRLRMLGRMSSSARRAQRLVEDLLDFTLVRVGRGLTVTRQPLDVHALVEATVDELALGLPDRTLDFVGRGDGGCSADPDRIAQLVGNLVSNAATHGHPDRPIVVRTQTDGAQVCISVTNSGTPIPAELQARIFEPMVRGAGGGNHARSVGLGLYIVRAIAVAHGGDVRVASSADGTTFAFTFPRGL